ncbi:phosphate ABC transporter substrate-binding protein [Idiomarina sp. X4]|uniref:Phosphate ABC transporter substrate-binding protein n=2 Tax=Idiomarinaceae TaxID=267893 RepID=A0ABM6LQ55_9GAMM|nr:MULTISPECIES: phosphate ABC transporter substrate-binding protein [Idiomarina]ASG64663.1 phosphate ABC transporter substrate-binding protein [Idiomarina piscisalsi]ATZ73214.1 phosphate ABC transporter substrate-binding protein [Idiomarina sp. X4]RXS43513.1 phosphate ABC transporter substrate-binding protein [Idiomarina sp. 29L]
MKKLAVFLIVLFAGMLSFSASANNGVVVSQTEINEESIARIYLGQSRVLTGVNLPEDSATRTAFEEALVGQTGNQLKRHWAKLKFTGRATPLETLNNDDAVIEFLKSNPQGIGYVSDKSKVSGDLKVIATF